MNKADVDILMAARSTPSVTITLPTHRTSPGNTQDPIRLKNLMAEAATRLAQDFSKRDLDGLLSQMNDLSLTVDHERNLDGLAFFVSDTTARIVRLPFPLRERVVVDDRFFTRDLVTALSRAQRYWVLLLSENQTRLYEGVRSELTEIADGGFPIINTLPGGARRLPGGKGIEPSEQNDRFHEQFFRSISEHYASVTKGDALPLVVVGVDRYLAFFRQVAAGDDVLTTVTGNYDHFSPHELGDLIWPSVQCALEIRRDAVFDELERSIGAGKVVSMIEDVWRYAHDGRGSVLVIEDGFHAPAQLDASKTRISISDTPQVFDVMDDVTDYLVEEILNKGGRVVFVPDGSLAHHNRLALILRY